MCFLDLLKLVFFSGHSQNENIILSCQPCVHLKRSLSLGVLGLALIGILHLILVYNLFLTSVTLKKQHLLLMVLCLEFMCFLDLMELYNLNLTKVTLKHYFLPALNVLLFGMWCLFDLIKLLKFFLAVFTLKKSTLFCWSFAWMF